MTVDALVLGKSWKAPEVLLVRRGKDPFAGMWALPGGFAGIGETLKEACLRELAEETGLLIQDMEQFRVFDALDRDPRHRTITVVFYVILTETPSVRGGDDASHASWFPLEDLPPLAFDHLDIIRQFLAGRGLQQNMQGNIYPGSPDVGR